MATRHQPSAPTILVVEDESSVREVMARFLEDVGYRVLTADDGDMAWSLLRDGKEAVALIVTDVIMPNMTGPELAERALTLSSPPRILLISGYPQMKLPPKHAFLSKPFRPHQFLDAIERLIGSRDSSPTSTTAPQP
jgi:CheY-like chemotaxis protein